MSRFQKIIFSLFAISTTAASIAQADDNTIRVLLKEAHMAHEVNVNGSVHSVMVRGLLPSGKKAQIRINFPISQAQSEVKKDCVKSANLATVDEKLGFELYLDGIAVRSDATDPRGYRQITADFPAAPTTAQSLGCGILNLKRIDANNVGFKWFEFQQ